MASTPITTPCRRKRSSSRGFTLVELLIGTSLSAIILAGVLSAVLMIARSGYLLSNYIDMEKEARAALETIAVDARVTESISWQRASATSPLTGIILTPPGSTSGVRYDYDSTTGTLNRTEGGKVRILVSGIQSLTFSAYKYADVAGIEMIDPAVTSTSSLNGVTKMLQISLCSMRSRSTLVDATNNVVSARYVLRNKVQTN
jgi:prepilin-type N-terminal cleavage/methylation domain-containing protein